MTKSNHNVCTLILPSKAETTFICMAHQADSCVSSLDWSLAVSQGKITRRHLLCDLRTLFHVELFVREEEEGVSISRRGTEDACSAIAKTGNTRQNGVRARK